MAKPIPNAKNRRREMLRSEVQSIKNLQTQVDLAKKSGFKDVSATVGAAEIGIANGKARAKRIRKSITGEV